MRDGGAYRLTTHGGDLRVGLGGAPNATVFVRTFQGDFSADFPIQLPEGQSAREGSKRFNFTLGSGSARIELQSFNGDILVSNNEKCLNKDNSGFGGLNLYDVTDAAHPTPLAEGLGDTTVNGQGKKSANEIHSVFAWDAGDRAYVVMTDNDEGMDVDIMDITNPRKPFLTAEYDLDETFPQITQATPENLKEVFLHDMVVKEIGGRQVMLLSYWDGGYIKLDVTDPANAVFIADTDYAAVDPVRFGFGQSINPEGNGHQAEFTRDNALFLATDEDFDPFRIDATIEESMRLTPIAPAVSRTLTRQLGELQSALLSPRGRMHDWQKLLDMRNLLHLLEDTCEDQHSAAQEWLDALAEWPAPADAQASRERELLRLRSRDVIEHIERVLTHVRRLESSIESAVPVLARLWTEGRGFSVDLLGEATVSEQEADRYRDRCLEALRLLGKATAAWPSVPLLERDRFGPLPRVNLSVKLSALYSQLDPVDPEGCFRAVAARLRPMLDLAATLPAAITFDMEQAELKDLTLMIFMRLLSEDAYRRYPHGGIAMQAYLRECAMPQGHDELRALLPSRRNGGHLGWNVGDDQAVVPRRGERAAQAFKERIGF